MSNWAKQRQKSESAKAECGMHWCCCYACGCYCCSVCIVWCPDVNESKSNECALFDEKKSKSIQLKKSERKACVHFLSLTLYVVHFISICLSGHSFFFLPFHPLISDGCVQQTNAFNRPQISWVIHVPNESSIENLCQPEKNIQHSTAQHSKRLYRIEYFSLRLTSLRQETIQVEKWAQSFYTHVARMILMHSLNPEAKTMLCQGTNTIVEDHRWIIANLKNHLNYVFYIRQ